MIDATNKRPWYEVDNINEIDSPALLIYSDRVEENIKRMVHAAGASERLRPHVKTHKMAEIVRMQQSLGIHQFKCATIAEAEMLALEKAKDVLLAYQATGPKINRLCALASTYPDTIFAVLVDNLSSAQNIAQVFDAAGLTIRVYIDLDVGMHRTGISPDGASELFSQCLGIKGIVPVGLHGYDGHIHFDDQSVRSAEVDRVHDIVTILKKEIETETEIELDIVVSGSPSFPYHASKGLYTCSPGTSVLWDWGYSNKCLDQDFLHAALVVSRVISKPEQKYICLDLGHKNIASEMPFPRVHFIGTPDAKQVKQSEEHLVLDVGDNRVYEIGQVFYGIPKHICPTVALHDRAQIVKAHRVDTFWKVLSRDRVLTI